MTLWSVYSHVSVSTSFFRQGPCVCLSLVLVSLSVNVANNARTPDVHLSMPVLFANILTSVSILVCIT